jgi:hypothetical protein
MRTLSAIPFSGHARFWLLVINFLTVFMLSSCGSSGGSASFSPENTLEGQLFVLGAQVDTATGDLIMYVTGTDSNGDPLTDVDLHAATVTVDTDPYTVGDTELDIVPVSAGDEILSLGLVTDYSNSTNGELQYVAGIFTEVLDSLPPVYEAQVMTFSDDYEMKQVWTTNLADLKLAVAEPHTIRNETALYDSMGVALEGDVTTVGVTERCRPAHMLVVFTDGDDNHSFTYTASGLASIANNDQTAVIMLGTSDAKNDVLTTLAGDYGAVVQVNDPSGLPVEVDKWTESLQHMVKFTLDATTGTGNPNFSANIVNITLGSQTVEVTPNSHCTTP